MTHIPDNSTLVTKALKRITPEALQKMYDAQKLKNISQLLKTLSKDFGDQVENIASEKIEKWHKEHEVSLRHKDKVEELSLGFNRHENDKQYPAQYAMLTAENSSNQNKNNIERLLRQSFKKLNQQAHAEGLSAVFNNAAAADDYGINATPILSHVEQQQEAIKNHVFDNHHFISHYLNLAKQLYKSPWESDDIKTYPFSLSEDIHRMVLQHLYDNHSPAAQIAREHLREPSPYNDCGRTKDDRMMGLSNAMSVYINYHLLEAMKNYGEVSQDINISELTKELNSAVSSFNAKATHAVNDIVFLTEDARRQANNMCQEYDSTIDAVMAKAVKGAQKQNPQGVLVCVPHTL